MSPHLRWCHAACASALVIVGCADNPTAAQVEERIRAWLPNPEDDLELEGVSCPKGANYGNPVLCKARMKGGGELLVVAKTDGGKINLSFKEKPIVGRKLEQKVAEYLAAKDVKVTVDCGQPVRRSQPGTSFVCKARDAETGKEACDVNVTVKDDQGGIGFSFSRALVASDMLEPRISEYLKQGGVDSKVHCGPRHRLAIPASKFRCVFVHDGVPGAVVVTIQDDEGAVQWDMAK